MPFGAACVSLWVEVPFARGLRPLALSADFSRSLSLDLDLFSLDLLRRLSLDLDRPLSLDKALEATYGDFLRSLEGELFLSLETEGCLSRDLERSLAFSAEPFTAGSSPSSALMSAFAGELLLLQ